MIGMRFPGGVTLVRGLALAIGVALALGGCTAPKPVPTISGDGDYRGTSTRSQQPRRRTCPRPGLINASVRNGVMFYRWEGQYIQVAVLNDGTLSGALGEARLTGTHDGGTMRGDVTDPLCNLHFTMKKAGG